MTAQELIQQEADRRHKFITTAPYFDDVNMEIQQSRKDFIEGATFGASLNGWVSVKDRLPTKEDSDNYGDIYVYYSDKSVAVIHCQDCINKIPFGLITHFQKIVKP